MTAVNSNLPSYTDVARGLLATMPADEAVQRLARKIYSDMIHTLGHAHRLHVQKVAEGIIADLQEST